MTTASETLLEDELHAVLNAVHGSSAVRRQAVLMHIARSAGGSVDPWRLARDAARRAAQALWMECYSVAQLTPHGAEPPLLFHFAEDALSESSAISDTRLTTAPDRSMTAYALEEGATVVAEAFSKDLRFGDPLLQRKGIETAIVSPLQQGDQPFGAIGVYGKSPRALTDDEVCFLELLARLVGAAVAHAALTAELADQRRRTEQLLASTDALVVTLTPQLKIQQVNRAFEVASGFTQHEIEQRPLSSAVLPMHDVNRVKQALDRVRNGEAAVKLECGLLTKQGEQRSVAWSYTPVTRADGVLESVVGTGVDLTVQRDTLMRLDKAESIARAATQRVAQLQRELEQRLADPAAPRADQRRPFPRLQQIAPIVDGALPDRGKFRQVRCRDISPGGLSFYLPEPPQFEELVVALGSADDPKYVTARVKLSQPTSYEGRPMQLVYCAYSGRLELISNSDSGDYFIALAPTP